MRAFEQSHLPSPDTSNEFKNLSSPALNVVTQSPDSRFIRLTYIRLRDKQTKCCVSWSPKYGIFWFITPFSVTCLMENYVKRLRLLKAFLATLNFPSFKSSTRISLLHNTARSKSPTGHTDDGCGTPFNVLTFRHLYQTFNEITYVLH